MTNKRTPATTATALCLGLSVALGIAGCSDNDNDGNSISGNDTSTPTGSTSDSDTVASSTAGVVCDYVYNAYNASASVEAMSESTWTCSDEARELTANGIPDHAVGTFPNQANPNTIAEQSVSISYTLAPVATDTSTVLGGPRGAVGYVLNGIKMDPSTGGSCNDSGDTCSGGDPSLGWNLEALGQTSFDFGADMNNAHVQPSGEYHYHGIPEGYIDSVGGDASSMTLIGWAADGFPIYARYGHAIPDDASSSLTIVEGSYQVVDTISETRPSTDMYPMGTFAQDWEYVDGSGDLDECNGRVGVTPEFPGGIYHYFATDSYPYMQRCVKGSVDASGPAGPGPAGPPEGSAAPGAMSVPDAQNGAAEIPSAETDASTRSRDAITL